MRLAWVTFHLNLATSRVKEACLQQRLFACVHPSGLLGLGSFHG